MKRLALALVLAGASAWAIPTGDKWATTAIPVGYKVFQHASINCPGCDFNSQVLPSVQSGFARWTKSQVACTSWDSHFLSTFTSPVGPAAINPSDNQNLVLWMTGGDWTQPAAVLGLTTSTFDSNTGQIFDADMQFNNNQTWKIGGSAQAVDVESIATHEAGHFLGLAHTPTLSAVMYATYTIGDIKRDLDPATDVQDVCTVYPTSGSAGTQGDLCSADGNCGTSAPICRGPAGGGGMICTKTCATPADCPTGYTCQASNSGNACLVPPGSPDLCKFCTDGTQCSNGLCVSDGPHMWCSAVCTTAANCGSGYTCSPAGSSNVCAPTNSACATAQCRSASDCPIGYACNAAHMCEATGRPGDRCEINAFCQACGSCIGTITEAYCRACCGGHGNGGACNLCPNNACSGPQTCAQVANGLDQVCIPGGQSTCQACDSNNPCQAGLSCLGALCHVPCNPQNPGNCQACADLGGGQGSCACPGEVSQEGQTCATDAQGGLHICSSGLACVGSPAVCRQPCPTGVCPSGMQCQPLSGQNVCLPSNASGVVCGPCNAGACGNGLTCYQGRCYTSCNPAQPACLGCVDVGTGGVCVCDDQMSVAGGFCGLTSGQPQACSPGLTCATDGYCHVNCDPAQPQCPTLQTCQASGGANVCANGTIVPKVDAGTGPNKNNGGCGCGTAPGASLLLLGLLSAALRRRRAR